MPQLVAVALAGAALWAGYRWLARETRSVRDAMQAAEEELSRRAARSMGQPGGANDADVTAGGPVDPKELPKLELDPQTGEYRLKK